MTRHTISVLVENKFGVLARVAGMFSGRGYNIHALNVGPSHDPKISRMTITVREKEPGCTMYQLCKTQEEGSYVLIERYTDQDALAAHMQTEHFKALLPKFGELLDGGPQVELLTEVS